SCSGRGYSAPFGDGRHAPLSLVRQRAGVPVAGNTPPARSHRAAVRLEARRDPAPHLPPYVLRGPAADARPRRPSEPLHRLARGGAWVGADGAAGLLTPWGR